MTLDFSGFRLKKGKFLKLGKEQKKGSLSEQKNRQCHDESKESQKRASHSISLVLETILPELALCLSKHSSIHPTEPTTFLFTPACHTRPQLQRLEVEKICQGRNYFPFDILLRIFMSACKRHECSGATKSIQALYS